jgi:ribosome-binding protein aMBF1 (putative translation factor)
MSQQQLADAIGASRSTVNAWENDRARPRYESAVIRDLEAVLGVSLTEDTDPEEEKIRGLGKDRGGFLDPEEVDQLVYAYRQRRDRGRLRQVS